MVIRGATAVVTGAGGGIGHAVARALAREGARLAICDSDEQKLRSLHGDLTREGHDAICARVDVADSEQVREFADVVARDTGDANILVNCAGVYICGKTLDLSLDDWQWVLSVNLFGIIHACHFFLPQIVRNGGDGHVANLASMYGYWPSPGVTGYLTSKFGVFGYSEALREDLRGTRVGVSTVCPGMINTGLVRNMRIRGAGTAETDVRAALQQTYTSRSYGPERVAAAIVKGIAKNKGIVLVSPEARIMYYVERYCPALSRHIARTAAKRMFRI